MFEIAALSIASSVAGTLVIAKWLKGCINASRDPFDHSHRNNPDRGVVVEFKRRA